MIRVMYKSRKNNKKVAQAMAKALGVEAESIDGAQEVKADLLFLGAQSWAETPGQRWSGL